ncbi:MAG: flagellar hook-associated protein FlgK [Gemmatimonadales bacterium]|nr:MAG: flagellar hook-associated protein FlgK [Gemmatimonadales bacterium]
MSSISGIFSIAASALRASQAGLAVTGQNVANVGTEGYSRQHLRQEAIPGVRLPDGRLGGGVALHGADRSRDAFLDRAFRTESSTAEGFRSHADLLRRLEGLTGEPGPDGLSSSLDRFLSAWSELASAPESPATRAMLRSEAETLARRINDVAGGVDRVVQEGFDRLTDDVRRAQALATELAAMNRSIVAAESDGMPTPDLRDSRDRLLDELAALLPVDVWPSADGSVRVTLGGLGLVEGPRAETLEVNLGGPGFQLRVGGSSITLSAAEGRVGGILEAINRDVPSYRKELDAFAQALVTSVNDLHRQGTNPLGQEGVDFFHVPLDGGGNPVPVSAAALRLSDAVLASPLAIAAGEGSDPGQAGNAFRSGANDVALSLAGLRDSPAVGLTGTLSAHLQEAVSTLAHRVRGSQDGAAIHGVLAQQAEIRRSEVSGVSLDEEMAKLIQFQASYAAAARVLSAADEMLQTLLRV